MSDLVFNLSPKISIVMILSFMFLSSDFKISFVNISGPPLYVMWEKGTENWPFKKLFILKFISSLVF